MSNSRQNTIQHLASGFERGVERFVREYSHRAAWERTMQGWLAISVATECPPQSILTELQFRKRDLCALLPSSDAVRRLKPESRGAFAYDLCLGLHDAVDATTWRRKAKTSDTYTIDTLSALAVVAELKIFESTATNKNAIEEDLIKLLAATQTVSDSGRFAPDEMLRAYQIVLLQGNRAESPSKYRRHLDLIKQSMKDVVEIWPSELARPVVLVGAATEDPVLRRLVGLQWSEPDSPPGA